MTAPRLEIDLAKIQHNARTLVDRLGRRGISVTGVTKAVLGHPGIANALLAGGVTRLADSRVENLETMRRANVSASMTLIRAPMISQAAQAAVQADISFNTELETIAALSVAAGRVGRTHGIVLMVELGDLREGILPADVEATVRTMLDLPNVELKGIGTNLACRSGVSPSAKNMAELSALADSIDTRFGTAISIVSGGNSANLDWALSGADTGRINDLRLGEALLLGCETLRRQPIDDLHTDAIVLVAEVIESKTKPSLPWGELAQTAFGEQPLAVDRGLVSQAILAVGRQDIDPLGLRSPQGLEVLGASSDHLIVNAGNERLPVGSELTFHINYSALVRAMTSPFVEKVPTPQASASARI